MGDPMTTETAEMFLRRAEAAEAELARVRAENARYAGDAERADSQLAEAVARIEAAERERDDALGRVSLLVGHLDRSDEKSAALLARAEAAEAERDGAHRRAEEWREEAARVAEEKVAEIVAFLDKLPANNEEASLMLIELRNRILAEFGSVAGDANEKERP